MSAQVQQEVQAEMSLLGGILLYPASLDDVAEVVRAEDFAKPAHQAIYKAMLALSLRSEVIEIVTLADELRKAGDLDAIGGPVYLSALDVCVPLTSDIVAHARIVADRAALRRMAQTAMEIHRDATAGEGTAQEILDRSGQRMMTATEREDGDTGPEHIRVILNRVYTSVSERYERQTDVTGIPTGIEALDMMTTGLHGGCLYIIAGRPGSAKTSAVMGWVVSAAKAGAPPSAVFSLEMPKDQLVERVLSAESRIPHQRIRTGRLLDVDWPRLAGASDKIARYSIQIDDRAGATLMQIRAKCRRIKAKAGLGMIVVDYIQLMRSSVRTDNREQEVAGFSRGLKEIAKEFSVPVVALAQLNRDCEKRADKRPMLSDLRESGGIEADADLVLFTFRESMYSKDERHKGLAELIIAKQRNGSTGTVNCAFLEEYMRFENLETERYGR